MKIKFTDIIPNPFRDFSVNPINDEKVAELKESIDETGFWDNVVVRPSPSVKGKYELAYGHHRVNAAKTAGLKEADFIVKEFSDPLMIKVMKNDNMEFGYSILGYIEAVQAVVKSIANGSIKVKVPENTPKEAIRHAPSYAPGGGETVSNLDTVNLYTPLAVAEFLGYTKSKGGTSLRADNNVQAALRALYLIEAGVYTIEYLKRQEWNTAQLLKNTQDAWNRLMEDRKKAAIKAEDQARIAKINADQKAFEAEIKAKREESQEKVRIAEEAKRKAEREEAIKEVKAAEVRRKKAAEDEELRILKAHVENSKKNLTKYGAPSAAIGVAVEQAVKEAESVLSERDVEGAKKLTTTLRKATEKITEAAKKKEVEAKPKEQPKNEAAISTQVMGAIKKISSIMSDGDVDRDINGDPLIPSIKAWAKGGTLAERNALYNALYKASIRLDRWATKFSDTQDAMDSKKPKYTVVKPKKEKA